MRRFPGLAPTLIATLFFTAVPPRASGQTTEVVGVSSSEVLGDQGSIHHSAITPDGRYVAFQSDSTNLVAGDTNGVRDIFVRDRSNGTTTRVSVSSTGAQSDDMSYRPTISADGRFVAYESLATNLIASDTNNQRDVFLFDRTTGQTSRISVSTSGTPGNGPSYSPFLSADGRFIAFASTASTLVPGFGNGLSQVYLRDRMSGITTLVSYAALGGVANDACFNPSLSADGRSIAFQTPASNLFAIPTLGFVKIFVRDRITGALVLASKSSSGAEAFGGSRNAMISGNGRVVAFMSDASNLVTGDTNSLTDVFTHDLDTAQTERVNVSSSGVQANGPSDNSENPPGISMDGRFVAFPSFASNLAPGWVGWTAVYLRDRALGVTTLASVSTSGASADNSSMQPTLSFDGRFLVFQSLASNLATGDNNQTYDIFVRGPLASPWSTLGFALAGSNGVPNLLGSGTLVGGSPGSLTLLSGRSSAPTIFFASTSSSPAPVACGVLAPLPYLLSITLSTAADGSLTIPWAAWPSTLSGQSLYFQCVIPDPLAVCGIAFSNALRGTSP